MSGESKTTKLSGKMLAVATNAVEDRSADASDAVNAALITTFTLARVCLSPSDDEFGEFVHDMSAVMLRHVTRWNEKVGAK